MARRLTKSQKAACLAAQAERQTASLQRSLRDLARKLSRLKRRG